MGVLSPSHHPMFWSSPARETEKGRQDCLEAGDDRELGHHLPGYMLHPLQLHCEQREAPVSGTTGTYRMLRVGSFLAEKHWTLASCPRRGTDSIHRGA